MEGVERPVKTRRSRSKALYLLQSDEISHLDINSAFAVTCYGFFHALRNTCTLIVLEHTGTTGGNYMRLSSVAVQREELQWHIRSLECDWADVAGEHSACINDIIYFEIRCATGAPAYAVMLLARAFLLFCRCNLPALSVAQRPDTLIWKNCSLVELVSGAVFPACTCDEIFVCKCKCTWICAVYRTLRFDVAPAQ